MLALLGLPSAGSIAKAIFDTAVSAAETAIADAVQKLLSALFTFIGQTTEPVFTSGWWTGSGNAIWLEVLGVSGSIMVIALMLAGLEGIWSGTTAPIAKALGAVPVAVVKTVALVSVVSLLVTGTDQIADYLDGSLVSQLGTVPVDIGAAIVSTGVVGMIFAAIMVIAVLGLWAELAVRAAVLYLVVMTAPMVIAAAVHPRLKQSWTKLAEIAAGVIFSKVLVALALAVSFSEIGGLTSSPTFSQAIGALVAGIATLAMSCFAPFLLFRLFSLEVAHLEGLARRPTRAARDAAQMSYYAGGLKSRGLGGGFLDRHSGDGDTPPGGGAGTSGRPGGGGGVPGGGKGASAAASGGAAGAVGGAAAAGASAAKKVASGVAGATRNSAEAATSGGSRHEGHDGGTDGAMAHQGDGAERGEVGKNNLTGENHASNGATDAPPRSADRGTGTGASTTTPTGVEGREGAAGAESPAERRVQGAGHLVAPEESGAQGAADSTSRPPVNPRGTNQGAEGPVSARDAVRGAPAGSAPPRRGVEGAPGHQDEDAHGDRRQTGSGRQAAGAPRADDPPASSGRISEVGTDG